MLIYSAKSVAVMIPKLAVESAKKKQLKETEKEKDASCRLIGMAKMAAVKVFFSQFTRYLIYKKQSLDEISCNCTYLGK